MVSHLWPLRNLGTISGKKWGSNSLPLEPVRRRSELPPQPDPLDASFRLIIPAQEQICRQKNDLLMNPSRVSISARERELPEKSHGHGARLVGAPRPRW